MWPFSRKKRRKSEPSADELLKLSIQEKLKDYNSNGAKAEFSGPGSLYRGSKNTGESAYELELIDFEESVN
jgi:hypothetical protein